MTEKQLWIKRHELRTEIEKIATPVINILVDELLEVERELVRKE